MDTAWTGAALEESEARTQAAIAERDAEREVSEGLRAQLAEKENALAASAGQLAAMEGRMNEALALVDDMQSELSSAKVLPMQHAQTLEPWTSLLVASR